MFDFMPVGAPATAVTLLYLVATANFVLPTKDNRDATSASAAAVVGKTISTDSKKARKFFCSFKLLAKSPMVGFTVARSGLLTAQDLKLVAVSRNGSIYPFDMEFVLEADDMWECYSLCEVTHVGM